MSLAVFLMCTSCDTSAPEPSQQSIAQEFHTHRRDFGTFLQLCARKPRILFADTIREPLRLETASGHLAANDPRYPVVKQMMNDLGIIRFEARLGAAEFHLWQDTSSLRGGPYEGLLYTRKHESPIFQSVDLPFNKARDPGNDPSIDKRSSDRSYARLAPNWYIFYDPNDA